MRSCVFFFQAEDGIRDLTVTGVQTCALPISGSRASNNFLRTVEEQHQASVRCTMKIGLSPLQGQASFEETLRECERAEAAGFDSIWLGEHHNNPILHPAPLIGLAAIASRTRRIHLGTGVLLLPLYHPVMVAEEGAMVDMISGGRLILGIGAGDRKSTRLNSSHSQISYAVFCLKKKKL